MGNSTKLVNKYYANLGAVKITFNDSTTQTHTITSVDSGDGNSPSVGTYFDQNSSRSPVEIEALGSKWYVSQLPEDVTYPDDKVGELSNTTTDSPWSPTFIIWEDEV
ncbi:MAG: hypothetical protein JST15_09695 [Bacteroidetes bacterium]|nr:hypothetical protein [Bacteroidota bacterium]